MTRIHDRRKALELRKLGKSYSQIKSELSISKSTLSGWLWEYPLNKEQIDSLRGKNPRRIEKYRTTMRLKREARLNSYYTEEKSKWLPLSKRELFIAGLFLYWGEGGKSLNGQLIINNTDPKLIKFMLHWLTNVIFVPKNKIKACVHLYIDMDIQAEINYWVKELGLPLTQFIKPYIKKSQRTNIDHKGFGHGTCGLMVNDARLKERVLMGISAMADYYSKIVT
ncbi:TPA: hypothetical protein DIV55_05965 [Patescibacteria group bacterium]|uniref:Uncharacterized protein n=1 Tax=Candidatus Gottesmanbacteria bacterium GW2011_GWA1_43_11 TaxID=1618436 RepID=A0A0G1FFC7_9BACT|nr:MAG: hypothetical protein UV59_C0006G0014 [Candidatus Gottesmanbacteria bacterium GW2011_GWA1_43_11]HCS79254.1 hypothetical protein [Patescibacteria group bacterium]